MGKRKITKCKQYGPLNYTKVCDYVILVEKTVGKEFDVLIIQFYRGKPFTADFFFDKIDKEEIFSQGLLWRKYYTNINKKDRRVSKHLAKMYWEEAKILGNLLVKADIDGNILKDYRPCNKENDNE